MKKLISISLILMCLLLINTCTSSNTFIIKTPAAKSYKGPFW